MWEKGGQELEPGASAWRPAPISLLLFPSPSLLYSEVGAKGQQEGGAPWPVGAGEAERASETLRSTGATTTTSVS